MALIAYPTLDECDDETRATLVGLRNEHGEIPAFPRMLAANPGVLRAALGQFGEVMYGGGLDPALKQLAFVVVSQRNACAYCAVSHGEELLAALGEPPGRLEALAAGDDAGLTQQQAAVAAFARRVAEDPKGVRSADVAALRAAGFDDAGVIELLAACAQAQFANTIADALAIAPGDQSPRLARAPQALP